MKNKHQIGLAIACITTQLAVFSPIQVSAQNVYEPTWNSLKKINTPQWLRDGKFGIYTHWGVYSVPAQGPNGTWYAKVGGTWKNLARGTTIGGKKVIDFPPVTAR